MVYPVQSMTRLKSILQSNWFYIITIILLIIHIIFVTYITKYQSKYSNDNTITGIVKKITNKNNKLSLLIQNDEQILVEYYYQEELPNIEIGDKIKVFGNKKEIREVTIPNNFDYQKYLYNHKIYLVFNALDYKIIAKNNNIINKVKNYLNKRIANNTYLSLFILGDKTNLDSDIYNNYQNIGVAHLLAISGLHLSIILLFLNKILFFITKRIKLFIIVSFLLIYAYIINYPPSFLRVLLFYSLSFINQEYYLNINRIQLLFLTAIILLFINPFYFFDIGFIFSFSTVFGIMISSKYLHYSYFKNLLLISLISFVFTFPIVVNLNYEINLITFLANLILVPLISFIIYPMTLISLIIPIIDKLLNILIIVMESITSILSMITFTKIIIPKLTPLFIIIYYITIILLIYFNKTKLFWILPLLVTIYTFISICRTNLSIIFFEVGQGDSSIIITPHLNSITMIDTGGIVKSNYHPSNNIMTYFKSIGISKINNLIITHGDYDHMGEARNIVNNFKVEKVIFNCGPYNDLEQELIKVLNKKKIKYYSCIKELNIDKNKLYFLQTKEYDNENDNSNVIYTELNNYKFMFMGDASINTEKEILNKYNLPDIDVVKVGHHGSKTSSSNEFINEINPKYSIISVGKNNRYGHPNKEALNNLEKSRIYRTDEDGSIMFKIENNKLKIETCSP